ncbi:hypothetical protein Tco_1110401 [Tanacetum coccineum]|uniref:Reverse transcriptase domain-containing protein n=1 Tax=Tanacetum coccineum TaxID=301880 RepID=A0ABQ5IKT0_9ASTR
MQLPPRKENQDRYCDYHREKGHYTYDCFQLKRQLEIALESGKLNHLIKDVRQRGRGSAKGRDAGNVEGMMNSDKRVMAGKGEDIQYLSVLNVAGSDFNGERSGSIAGGGVVKPLGKIELEVVFGDGGLFRTVMINFTEVRAPSPYNVIFERTGLRALRAVSSTIHSMIKFPTLRGIATLVTQTMIIAECQKLEKKQMVEKEASQNTLLKEEGPKRVDMTEQTLVNPAYRDQLVTIGGNLSGGCKNQLKTLLKKSMDIFAWEPADMTGIPRRIIEHSLNVNPSMEPFALKRRVMTSDRTQAIIKEVGEWVNAGIVRRVKYPTSISNPVLVKKDAYKGYHQVQMALDDEEKTALYTYHGTYCYTKMPFRLKNAGLLIKDWSTWLFNPRSEGT